MECAVITTYRCNANCGMCHTWRHPSKASEEFNPAILEKIPEGMTRLNITGGEPFLRQDLHDIVKILHTKTRRLEISTNGFFVDKIGEMAALYPDITFRISIEGLPALNDTARGIRDGFDHAMRSLLRLKRAGVKDIGFAMTISGENARDLIDLYTLVASMDVELANAVVHNSFYFHKNDNEIRNPEEVEAVLIRFIETLLKSPRKNLRRRLKDWGRAYLNLGLLKYVRGENRTIPCGAGTDTFFVDPWGALIACNGSDEPLVMGDLKHQAFEEIWHGDMAARVRKSVSTCPKKCWMTGTAVPAMRKNPLKPLIWVAWNKWLVARGLPVVTK